MALIIITGHPSSGKTHRATQLHAAFTSIVAAESTSNSPSTITSTSPSPPPNPTTSTPNPKTPKYNLPTPISDHSLHLPRSLYLSASTEKTLRATLYSAVKRALGPGQVVILDSGNYIKGWRYQLYCEAKAVGVRSCVVHVGVEGGVCGGWNEGRLSGVGSGAFEGGDGAAVDGEESGEYTGRVEQSSGAVSHAAPAAAAVTATALASLSVEESSSTTPASSEEQERLSPPPPPQIQGTQPPPPQSLSRSQPQTEAPPPPPPPTHTINGPLPTDPYSPTLHAELITRYEEPNAASRWDSPLYTVVHTDAAPPADRIWREVVLGLKADGKSVGEVRRNAATVSTPPTPPTYLQTLDTTTQHILSQITSFQNQAQEPNTQEATDLVVALPSRPSRDVAKPRIDEVGPTPGELVVRLPARKLTVPHLQRLRREFTQLQRQQVGSQGIGAVGGGGGGGGGGKGGGGGGGGKGTGGVNYDSSSQENNADNNDTNPVRAAPTPRTLEEKIAALFVDWLNDRFEGR